MHSEDEIDRAAAHGALAIGVNNRDLSSFRTDLALSERLIPRLPAGVVAVSESGINTQADAARARRAGAHAVLVGESLMRAADPAALCRVVFAPPEPMALTPTETRDLLARLGHVPKRFLGQNFLVDGNIVRKSLELARVAPGDAVVEIGPGLGTLTAALLEAGAEVWAVERDRTLSAHLSASLAPRFPGTLHLTEADAVELPLAGLPAERAPAARSWPTFPMPSRRPGWTPSLSGPLPSRMVLMLQREAAERYTALPGTRSFGAISIFLQGAYDAAPGHRVSSSCFHPRPDVDSTLLNLVRKAAPHVFCLEHKMLIRSCFQQRRKQMGAVIRARQPGLETEWLGAPRVRGISHPRSGQRPSRSPVWIRLVSGPPGPA